jgi:hypothetical protein
MRVIPSFLPINPAGTVGGFPSGLMAERPRTEPMGPVRRSGRVDDVDEALVRPNLELLPAVLVDERAANDGVLLDAGRQRDRAGDVGSGPLRGLHDLLGRLVEQLVVVRLESDADALLGHNG